MIFQVYMPSGPLQRFIENFVYYLGFRPQHLLERLLPDGPINLVF